MDDKTLEAALRRLLSESEQQSRLFELKQQAYRAVARQQKIALQIGRLKIDAARAALEAQLTSKRR